MAPRLEDYEAGWVCALPKELVAARAMLDEEYEPFKSRVAQDNNSYVLGRIHGHNVVLACLPMGIHGTVSAATVAINMLRTFPSIRFGLMVGIGGGIPNLSKGVDIRLGDVVVSQPDGTHGGVVQHDLKKNLGEGVFMRKSFLNTPPTLLLTALANLQTRYSIHGNQISAILSDVSMRLPQLTKAGYTNPGPETDLLHCSNIEAHKQSMTCRQCQGGIIRRGARNGPSPEVHYGVIASGNELMKNVVERDRLGQELGAKCVEMEAAGLMNDFPCVVIRGICDYADSYKNDSWQEYAAVTAAAFAKELLSIVKPLEAKSLEPATEVIRYNLGLNLFEAPYMANDKFIGRQTELHKMESILQPDSGSLGESRNVLVVGGMGGIGKTQLTISFARRHHHSYSSIFWLNATSEASLQISLRHVASRVFPPEMVGHLEDDQLRVRISNWMSELENTRWLIIFDNYDDPDQYDVTRYFPYVTHGSVIITTRQPDRVSGTRMKLRSMTEIEDSLRILATRSGREDAISDLDARKLAERLDGHPLALATAGSFLSQSAISFSKYLQQYEAKWKVVESMTALSDYPSRTQYTTWDMSFAQIQQVNEKAAHLLRFLAYLDHQDIWYDLLQSGQDENQPVWFTEVASDEFVFEEAMQTLTRYCLLDSHYQSGFYSLHVCVHDWTLNGLNHEIDSTRFGLAVACITGCVRNLEAGDMAHPRYHRLNAHAERLLHDRFSDSFNTFAMSPKLSEKIARIANLLRRQTRYQSAERMFQRALAGSEQALGPLHRSTPDFLSGLGLCHWAQDRRELAEQCLRAALAGYEQILHPKDLSIWRTVSNLGELYRGQDKLELAEQYFQRALAGYEQTLGPEHLSTLDIVENLGRLYKSQNRLELAEQHLQRALTGYEQTLGPEDPSTSNIVETLGGLYWDQGRLDLAEQNFQRTLAGYEQTLGPEHPSTLDTVNNLANLYWDQGRLDLAEAMYERVRFVKAKSQSSKSLPIGWEQRITSGGRTYYIDNIMRTTSWMRPVSQDTPHALQYRQTYDDDPNSKSTFRSQPENQKEAKVEELQDTERSHKPSTKRERWRNRLAWRNLKNIWPPQ